MTTPRLSVGVIGDDPRGVALAQALRAAGHSVVARSVPPEDRADHVDALLPEVPVHDVTGTTERSDVVVLATSGTALETVVDAITDVGRITPGQIICRFEPLDAERIKALEVKGVVLCRLVPMLTLTGSSLDVSTMRRAFCAVVSAATVWPVGQTLVAESGMTPFFVSEEAEHALDEAVTQLSTTMESFSGQLRHVASVVGPEASDALASWLSGEFSTPSGLSDV